MIGSTVIKQMRYTAIRAGLELSAIGARAVPAGARGLIFTLHHVRPERREEFDPNGILSITPAFLGQAVQVALDAGLTPVHLHDLPALLAKQDGRKFVAFTLDDGYRNNVDHAAPIFRKYATPFTIFVTRGFAERSRSMWWETAAAIAATGRSFDFDFGLGPESVETSTVRQKFAAFDRFTEFVKAMDEDKAIRAIDTCAIGVGIDPLAIVDREVMTPAEMKAAGEDPLLHLGAHSLSHVNLMRVDDKRLAREIEGSGDWIEALTGTRPRSFAYPYGWSTAACTREFAAVQAAGFDIGVTTRPGLLTAETSISRTSVPRVSLNGNFQKARYVRALISGLPFKLL